MASRLCFVLVVCLHKTSHTLHGWALLLIPVVVLSLCKHTTWTKQTRAQRIVCTSGHTKQLQFSRLAREPGGNGRLFLEDMDDLPQFTTSHILLHGETAELIESLSCWSHWVAELIESLSSLSR